MRSFLARGARPNVLSVMRNESDWLDIGGYADASFIVEASSLTDPRERHAWRLRGQPGEGR